MRYTPIGHLLFNDDFIFICGDYAIAQLAAEI